MKYTSVIIDQINQHYYHNTSQHRLKLVERNIYRNNQTHASNKHSQAVYHPVQKCIENGDKFLKGKDKEDD